MRNMYLIDTDTHYLFQKNDLIVINNWTSTTASSICTCDTIVSEVLTRCTDTIKNLVSNSTLNSYHGTIGDAYYAMHFWIARMYSMKCYEYSGDAINEYQKLVLIKCKAGHNDRRIAATAIANDLVVVTRNYKDFLPLLPRNKIEDWSRPDRGESAF